MAHTKKLLLLVLAGSLFAMFVILLGSLASLGTSLGRLHPWLEYGFYALSAAVVIFLIVVPAGKLFAHPEVPSSEVLQDSAPPALLGRIATNLVASASDQVEIKPLVEALACGADLRGPVRNEITRRQSIVIRAISNNAVTAFTLVAISQGKTLDTLLVISINCRMILEIVKISGFRPTVPQLVQLYFAVALAALTVEGIEDLEIGQVVGKPIEGFISAIPVAGVIAAAAAQGVGGALFTLFVGHLTNYYLQTGLDRLDRRERRQMRLEAMKYLPDVLSVGAETLSGGIGKGLAAIADAIKSKTANADQRSA